MMKSDPYLARIEAFNLKNGGGVTIKKVQNGYNLYLTATDAPIARLNPSGTDDKMRIKFWSYRGHWKDVGCVRLTDASAAGASPAERKGSHHFHREPCAGHREVSGEASVAACTGRAKEPRKS